MTAAAPAERGADLRDVADRAADRVTSWLGSLPVLVAAVALVFGWLLTGPLFGFSNTWQLFINTTTTVITFWMMLVIQNTSNRQSKAVALKLDELIRVMADARDEFVDLDHASERELAEHEREFEHLAHPGQSPVQTRRTRDDRSTTR